jgi:hypothetical protein
MKPDLWTQRITKSAAPPYPCPHCLTGVLILQKAGFLRHSTVASDDQQPEHGFDPNTVEYTFSCWLKCPAPKCGEMVAIVGTGFEEPVADEENGMAWEEFFVPRFAWPMPPMFTIPEGCPAPVANELHASFQAAWNDRAAAASRLRVATERLLDSVGIARRQLTKKKKYEMLRLHRRIELLGKTQSAMAKNLMAIKWLGNTGSHDSAVSFKDLLDAYEIMEPTLDGILGSRAKRIARLAKQLTKKHGRRKR